VGYILHCGVSTPNSSAMPTSRDVQPNREALYSEWAAYRALAAGCMLQDATNRERLQSGSRDWVATRRLEEGTRGRGPAVDDERHAEPRMETSESFSSSSTLTPTSSIFSSSTLSPSSSLKLNIAAAVENSGTHNVPIPHKTRRIRRSFLSRVGRCFSF